MCEKRLDPIVSEFETEAQAENYDRWFRAKVQAALDDPGRLIPRDEAMVHIRAMIKEAAKGKSA